MRLSLVFLVFISLSGCTDKVDKEPVKEQLSEFEFVIDEKPFKDWHIGKFYYKEPKIGTFLINRTDSIQEEFIKSSGMIVEFDIEWTSDSTYILSFAKISENPGNNEIAKGAERMVKKCTMTKLTELSYIEKATSNLSADTILTKIYRTR